MILEHRTPLDWLRLAATTAAEASEDCSTQNGAVVAPEAGFVTAAANHFPAGVRPRVARPDKYTYIEHAERAAIYAAARIGTKTAGATLYCLWFACPECARAIICAGIKEVVGHVVPRQATPDRWVAQVVAGEAMLRDGGIGMRWLTDRLGVTIKFDGKEMHL
jgi:dCMP deaminase